MNWIFKASPKQRLPLSSPYSLGFQAICFLTCFEFPVQNQFACKAAVNIIGAGGVEDDLSQVWVEEEGGEAGGGGWGGGGVEGEGKWRLAISGRVDSRQGEGWQELLWWSPLAFWLANTSINQIDNRWFMVLSNSLQLGSPLWTLHCWKPISLGEIGQRVIEHVLSGWFCHRSD